MNCHCNSVQFIKRKNVITKTFIAENINEDITKPDEVVVSRAREFMAKHGEKNFSVAKTTILLADPALAEAYKECFVS